jgi:uncharacterized protein YndB with AHSA1/START domain
MRRDRHFVILLCTTRTENGDAVDEFHGSANVLIDATPDQVFAVLTDIERLPVWNAKVHHVIELPDGPVVEDAEWVIEMRAMGTRWPSRSHATAVDPANWRFEYTSCTDDGNPSYALWSWEIRSHARGSELTVTWAMYVRSFWRRVLLSHLRKPKLEAEIRVSLAGLNSYFRLLEPDIQRELRS